MRDNTGFPALFRFAILLQTIFICVEKSEAACFDVLLADSNHTVSISTTTWEATGDVFNTPYPEYCWNITGLEGLQMWASCQFHHAGPYSLYLGLSEGQLSFGLTDSATVPDEIYLPAGRLLVYIITYNLEDSASCEVRTVPDDTDLLCGPTNITLRDQYLLRFSIAGSRVYVECVWLVDSAPGTSIYLDLLDIGLHSRQRIAFGRGHDRTNFSSLRGEIDSLSAQGENGTSYFFTDTRLWISFSSSLHRDDNGAHEQTILLRSTNSTVGQVECSDEQILCLRDSKCIPPHATCDGKAHCSDYTDEDDDCDYCGTSKITLYQDEPLTILGDFSSVPNTHSKRTGFYAVYTGKSQTVPNTTSSDRIIVRNHTESLIHFECLWRLEEPNGSRIKIEVMEFEGSSVIMTIRNGIDPVSGVPLLVMDTRKRVPLPSEYFSTGAGMWITLGVLHSNGYLRNLRLVATTYVVAECGSDQFACPSGLGCLKNASYECDGFRHCVANGDELGCGECEEHEFECSFSRGCVPGYELCNGNADCSDHSDEFLCGYCGNESIHTRPHETFLLEHSEVQIECLWVVIGQPGTRIQASIRQIPWCVVTIGTHYHARGFGLGDIIRTVDNSLYYRKNAFPPSITTNSSTMWITNKCTFYSWSTSPVAIAIHQYTDVECSPGELRCSSGLACVQATAVCDGQADCPDYWDEIGCGNCTENQFACRTEHECVASSYICDGKTDCTDLSDEFDCAPCGETFVNVHDDSPSTIHSPGWPNNEYLDKARCLWLVVAEVGYRIVLTFIEFLLEEGYDYLYSGNGVKFDASFLKITGRYFPLSVASRNNTMFVIFTSDQSVRERGFSLRAEQKPAQTVSCGEDEIACTTEDLICVRNDTSERGRALCSLDECGLREYHIWSYSVDLRSPGYPTNYPAHIYCLWEIKARKSQSILVSILDFHTERSRDRVVFEGSTLHGGAAMSFELHGNTKMRSLAFNSTVLRVHFKSDRSVTYTGFHLRLFGNFSATNETSCPHADLFDCGDGSCVSQDARCDGFKDCQTDGLDELDCERVSCPDFFHCDNSTECIYWSSVCNGNPDCPNEDDETDWECEHRCPYGCHCQIHHNSLSVNCSDGWNITTIYSIAERTQILVLSGGNGIALDVGLFKEFSYLKGLWLHNNNINDIAPGTFDGLDNLTFLDISDNDITSIGADSFLELQSLETMFAWNIPLETIMSKAFAGLYGLQNMVLIRGTRSLDTPMIVKDGALTDLVSLSKLYVDDYRLCCEFVSSIPGFQVSDCETTEMQPPLNLCGSLMQNTVLRVFMWTLGLSALIGNAVVIIWRCFQGKEHGGKKTHSFFVLNLAVSDFMMGVYMLIIAGADVHFGEEYYHVASEWRSSVVCKIAGVLSVLSSEASVFFVTLISLDCYLSIMFPFSRVALGEKSAHLIVITLWLAALGLSVGPTVFEGPDSEVYGLSDVCIGLPFTTKPTSYLIKEYDIGNPLETHTILVPQGQGAQPAWVYSIALFLGVNFLCFFVVFCCYVSIFVKVKRTARVVRATSHRDREIKMAVKMALIVGTDFACWMPVIVMGILSQTGAVEIGPDVYAWIVVFILPINSSLNPYLYTLYTTVAARRHAQSMRSVKSNLTTEMKTKSMETLHSSLTDIQNFRNL